MDGQLLSPHIFGASTGTESSSCKYTWGDNQMGHHPYFPSSPSSLHSLLFLLRIIPTIPSLPSLSLLCGPIRCLLSAGGGAGQHCEFLDGHIQQPPSRISIDKILTNFPISKCGRRPSYTSPSTKVTQQCWRYTVLCFSSVKSSNLRTLPNGCVWNYTPVCK